MKFTSDDLFFLVKSLTVVRNNIALFLLDNDDYPDKEWLRSQERRLTNAIDELRKSAYDLIGKDAATAIAKLKTITERANKYVEQVEKIRFTIEAAVKLLGVAAAVSIGDAAGLVAALMVLVEMMTPKEDEPEEE